MLNEELVVISRIQKYLKESYQNVADAMIGGGIDNMKIVCTASKLPIVF